MNDIGLGIAGLGTVAQGVLQILSNNGAAIAQRSGCQLRVQRIASRSARDEVDMLGAQFSTNLQDLIEDPQVDIVLELIGGEDAAKDLIHNALLAGKPVVTANKAVIANHGDGLFAALQAANESSDLRFEAAVAGAIPIISAIREGLVANRFEHVVGIINGTCNYILTAMQNDGAQFSDALATAQELGYAEADPGFDIDGIDAAHKLTILLALAFDTHFDFSALHVEGITAVTAEDIRYAAELGYRIKHLGIARRSEDGLEARVHPALIPQQQLLANVDGVLNAVLVKSDAAGHTMFSGPGAGGAATASAVLADVVSVAASLRKPGADGGKRTAGAPDRAAEQVVLPISEAHSGHYLRIPSRDEPGVFARVAEALSRHEISIEAAIQKEPDAGQDVVSIVILTHTVQEAKVVAALEEVQDLPQVVGPVARIRVETLD